MVILWKYRPVHIDCTVYIWHTPHIILLSIIAVLLCLSEANLRRKCKRHNYVCVTHQSETLYIPKRKNKIAKYVEECGGIAGWRDGGGRGKGRAIQESTFTGKQPIGGSSLGLCECVTMWDSSFYMQAATRSTEEGGPTLSRMCIYFEPKYCFLFNPITPAAACLFL